MGLFNNHDRDKKIIQNAYAHLNRRKEIKELSQDLTTRTKSAAFIMAATVAGMPSNRKAPYHGLCEPLANTPYFLTQHIPKAEESEHAPVNAEIDAAPLFARIYEAGSKSPNIGKLVSDYKFYVEDNDEDIVAWWAATIQALADKENTTVENVYHNLKDRVYDYNKTETYKCFIEAGNMLKIEEQNYNSLKKPSPEKVEHLYHQFELMNEIKDDVKTWYDTIKQKEISKKEKEKLLSLSKNIGKALPGSSVFTHMTQVLIAQAQHDPIEEAKALESIAIDAQDWKPWGQQMSPNEWEIWWRASETCGMPNGFLAFNVDNRREEIKAAVKAAKRQTEKRDELMNTVGSMMEEMETSQQSADFSDFQMPFS